MSSPIFQKFRDNLKVRNADDISTAYGNITKRLNKDFWNLDSDLYHRRQLGSYGRQTAIHGVSDLDMAFELPWTEYEKYKAYDGNGPSQLLQAVRGSLKSRYPSTEIRGDGTSSGRLRRLAASFPWLAPGQGLRFHVSSCNAPQPYQLLWKVRNVGLEAEQRKELRGQILHDEGRFERRERTTFAGAHFVEAYIVKDGVCIARDIIDVPIAN